MGFVRGARFSLERVEIDNQARRLSLVANLDAWGFRNLTRALGGYWFRRVGNSYYYVRSACRTNVPGGYLGLVWSLVPAYDHTFLTRIGFWVGYDCFADQSGTYYGELKLYEAASISDPNAPVVAVSRYVSITWQRSSALAEDSQPVIRLLDEAESRKLREAIESAGGVQLDGLGGAAPALADLGSCGRVDS